MTAAAIVSTATACPDLPFPHDPKRERDDNQRLRLLMETLSSATPESSRIESSEIMSRRLRMLVHEIETRHADLLELLARFDAAGGWKRSGARIA